MLIGHEAVLRSKAEPVTSAAEANDLVRRLESVLVQLKDAAGLAAPQIGINKAVAIIRYNDFQMDIINPTVTVKDLTSENIFVHRREGCMSFPGRWFDVPRYKLFTFESDALWSHEDAKRPVNAADCEAGKLLHLVRRSYAFQHDMKDGSVEPNLVAVAAQHEIDHLNGVVLPDRSDAVEVTKDVDRVAAMTAAALAPPTVGRNDPCPCGSGRKYKKCCLK